MGRRRALRSWIGPERPWPSRTRRRRGLTRERQSGLLTPVCNPACRPRVSSQTARGARCKAMAAKFLSGWMFRKLGSTFAGAGRRQVERVANTPEALAAWVAQARPARVAMEPTGGYERGLCSALAEAGIRYVKLHPNTILAFRRARGLRAKTDLNRCDADRPLSRRRRKARRSARDVPRRRAPEGAGRPAQAACRRPPGGRPPRRSGERADRPGESRDRRRGADQKPGPQGGGDRAPHRQGGGV